MLRLRVAPLLYPLALLGAPRLAFAAPTEALTNDLAQANACPHCHSFGNVEPNLTEPLYAPVFGWTGSMMANAARDPIFWGAVAVAAQDHGEETEQCIRCHSPRAFLDGGRDAISMAELAPTGFSGVECEFCHRLVEDDSVEAGNALFTLDDTLVDGEVPRRGPWTYELGPDGRPTPGSPLHQWIQDPYLGQSRMCGTCHDVTTGRPRLDDDGEPTGTLFNEQRTYSEWLGSAYNGKGPEARSCQDCHMPAVPHMPGCADNAQSGFTHETGGRRHDLAGANRFMISLLRGIYGSAGTDEIDDFYFDQAIEHTDRLLGTAATVEVIAPTTVDAGAGLPELQVVVTNNTGHKLPTGYSEGRIMWIEVVARYGDEVLWSSGLWQPGRGPEQDPQLRTYQAIAEDMADGAQFHLTRNNHWVEDTRIPPLGLAPNIETDPVGDRYVLQDDNTWPNVDTTTYSFTARNDVVDQTPASQADDVLDLDVRLLYLINTPEYVEFLAAENRTNDAGGHVFDLFEAAGGATPVVVGSQKLQIPLTGLQIPAGDSSSGDTSTTGTTTDAATQTSDVGPSSSSSDDTGGSSGTTTDSPATGGPSGCGCAQGGFSAPAWLILGLGFARRRRRSALGSQASA